MQHTLNNLLRRDMKAMLQTPECPDSQRSPCLEVQMQISSVAPFHGTLSWQFFYVCGTAVTLRMMHFSSTASQLLAIPLAMPMRTRLQCLA